MTVPAESSGWFPRELVGHIVASLARNPLATTLVVGLAVGVLSRSVDVANSIGFVLMFVPYVSTDFVPAHTMPGVLRAFAEHLPLTPLVDAGAIRGGPPLSGRSLRHEALLATLYCPAVLGVASVGASLLSRRRAAAWAVPSPRPQ